MYKRILVVVADDTASTHATKAGVEIAKSCDADIVFFYVQPSFSTIPRGEPHVYVDFPDSDFQRKLATAARRKLAAASEHAEREGVLSLCITGQHDDAAKCVADAAESRHCNMIVVATERKNAVMRMVSGSIVPRLLTLATVPVLVCTNDGQTPHTNHNKAVSTKKRPVSRLPF